MLVQNYGINNKQANEGVSFFPFRKRMALK